MVKYKCLSCQSDLDLSSAVNGTVVCKNCGCAFLVPVRNLQAETETVNQGEVIRKVDPDDKINVSEQLHALHSDRLSETSATVSSMIIRAKQFFEDGDKNSAVAYYNKALDIDPHNVEAWWGLFLADFGTKNEKALLEKLNCRLYDEILTNRNYINAVKYSTVQQAQVIEFFTKRLESGVFWWQEFLCEMDACDVDSLVENIENNYALVYNSRNFYLACKFAEGAIKDAIEEFLERSGEVIGDLKNACAFDLKTASKLRLIKQNEVAKAEKSKAKIESEHKKLNRKYVSRSDSVTMPFWITFGVVAAAGVVAWFIALLVVGFQNDLMRWDLKDITAEYVGQFVPEFIGWCYPNGILMIIVEALLYGVICGFAGALLLLFTVFLPGFKRQLKKNRNYDEKTSELNNSETRVGNLKIGLYGYEEQITELSRKINEYDKFLNLCNSFFEGDDGYAESYTIDSNGVRRDY